MGSGGQHRKWIVLSYPREVREWCNWLGCTEAELRTALQVVGHSTEKIRERLGALPDRRGLEKSVA